MTIPLSPPPPGTAPNLHAPADPPEAQTWRPRPSLSGQPGRSRLQRWRIPLLRGLFALLVLPVLLIRPAWPPHSVLAAMLHLLGVLYVFAAVLGRFWAILYIGGRKNTGVMQDGPYSICRHPLYLFSTIGAVGFGLLLQSVTVAILTGGTTFLVLLATARHEEEYLRRLFGPAYDDYARRVPRLIPALHLFRTEPEVTFRVAKLRTNFADAMVFLALIPLAELINALHAQGLLPGIAGY